MSKQALISSAVAFAITIALVSAGAGWWALLVYVVDICSYGCGIWKGSQP